MSTKYKGTALVVQWVYSGGTVNLTADSRVFEIDEQANDIDVTCRGDTAKNTLPDFPAITWSLTGLDPSGTTATSQLWDTINIGDTGTIQYSPEGTTTSNRKRQLATTIKSKNFSSPYDGAVSWKLEGNSNGGTVIKSTWA